MQKFGLIQIKKNTFLNIEDVSTEKAYAGRKKYNNIYDLLDDVIELTSEVSYDTLIVRGISKNEESNRYSIFKKDTYYTKNQFLGFRTILYK